MSDYKPNVGDTVHRGYRYNDGWQDGPFLVVTAASPKTITVRHEDGKVEVVRHSKYGGYRVEPAKPECVAYHQQRLAWAAAEPRIKDVDLHRTWGSATTEAPVRVRIENPDLKPAALRALAAGLERIAVWLEAQPKRPGAAPDDDEEDDQ